MRSGFFRGLSGLVGCLLLSASAWAGGHNPADYPLRVHVYEHNGHSHYYDRSLDAVDGEGRANLYENGQPLGFDFSYSCAVRLQTSAGMETYIARWKKPGKSLEILLAQFGKPGAFAACELKVLMKENTVYHKHNGLLGEEPAAHYKEWMDKHQYDPEHGKNEPVALAGESAAGVSANPSQNAAR